MNEGTRVTWTTSRKFTGSGTVISNEVPEGPTKGHVLVAKDAPVGEEHPVIYCATTWLTEQTEEVSPT
jgi:hypothetical protein